MSLRLQRLGEDLGPTRTCFRVQTRLKPVCPCPGLLRAGHSPTWDPLGSRPSSPSS